jgi:predicted O-methyltransferase YrrM
MRASADLVFVDGDHSFDAVLADSRSAFDLIRPGGVVVWHDYRVIAEGVL